MKFNELKVNRSASRKRVGRGISAGQGKTAGRGTKGQNSRTGGGTRRGFEGGQNPLIARIPKQPGFKSKRTPKQEVTTGSLNALTSEIVDITALKEAGIVKSANRAVKLILKGELSKALSVNLDAASKGAIAAIDKAGGAFTATPTRVVTPKEKKTPKTK